MSRENVARDPYSLPQEPELGELLRVVERNIRLRVRTHVPASVVSYDPALQKAVVQVQILPVVRVTDATKLPAQMLSMKGVPPNAEATLAPLQLMGIPVVWPRTSSGYVTFPLLPGDTGELHVSDRSLEAWLTSGAPTEPVAAFTHALKDSVFHPGLHADTAPITPPTDITATVLDGAAQIKIGRLATDSPVLSIKLLTQLVAAVTATTTVPLDGGASFKTTLLTQLGLLLTPALIGATKVKAE